MKTATWTICFIVAFAQTSYQKSTPESDSYVAAVVEFSPIDPTSPNEPPTMVNAVRYLPFIEKAANQSADIIVFPEVALTTINLPERARMDSWTTFVPAPSRNYNPCIHSTVPVGEALKIISCSARNNSIYVVINIAEKMICNNDTCPSDKRFYYNTNVVFNREGTIIARYRKSYLYKEPQIDVKPLPEIVTFETDFGVTFGTFICADILYKYPTVYLTRMLNITDIIFPTAWFTELPFSVPLSIQFGFSYAEDVNFLVAGYNRPKFGNGGSGIYLGREGIGKAIMPQITTNELLVLEVPKKNYSSSAQRLRPGYHYSAEEIYRTVDEEEHHVHDELRRRRSIRNEDLRNFHDELRKKRSVNVESTAKTVNKEDNFTIGHFDLSKYKSLQFNSSIMQTLCDGDFCCDFDVQLDEVDSSTRYRLMVYNGTAVYDEPYLAGINVCAVVLCLNDSDTSCGYLGESLTHFISITINATYPNYEDIIVMPSSADFNLYPLVNWGYEERYEEKKVHIHATLGTSTRNLVTCGLYTRDFARDNDGKKSGSTSGMQWATLTALAFVAIFLVFLYRKGWRKPWQRNSQLSSDAGLLPIGQSTMDDSRDETC